MYFNIITLNFYKPHVIVPTHFIIEDRHVFFEVGMYFLRCTILCRSACLLKLKTFEPAANTIITTSVRKQNTAATIHKSRKSLLFLNYGVWITKLFISNVTYITSELMLTEKTVTVSHFFLWVLNADFCFGISNVRTTYGFLKIYRHEFKRSRVRILTESLFIFRPFII